MTLIASLTLRIVPVETVAPGSCACEIFYTWMEAGQERHALTRIPHSPMPYEAERMAFMRRNNYTETP